MVEKLIELIKQVDISKYTQEEYIEVVDAIFIEVRQTFIEDVVNKVLDESGWRDTGGQG
tara:strand:+ start:2285 stop:2461 length:177 start_codon:yes stop_codon:yes gene_type:complete